MTTFFQAGSGNGEVVSLTTAKQHMRVDHDEEDALISSYVSAAISWLESVCNTVFLTTPFTATSPNFDICFDSYPNPAIQTVSYVDENNVERSFEDYKLVGNRLVAINPPHAKRVTVGFTAGQGAGNIAPPLISATLMIAASLFENRSQTTNLNENAIPWGVDILIAPYRSFAHA